MVTRAFATAGVMHTYRLVVTILVTIVAPGKSGHPLEFTSKCDLPSNLD
jgi:hypothetical protein